MTEDAVNEPETETAEEPAEDVERIEPEAESHDAPSEDVAVVRKEAAGYRRKLRDAEGARDALAGRLEALQRAEVERIAAQSAEGYRPLSDGGDVWRHEGVVLGAMLDDDGNVDPAKVRATAAEVGGAHPGWRVHSWGSADAGRGASIAREPNQDFADALRGVSRAS